MKKAKPNIERPKTFMDYLPKKKKQALVQAHIDSDLVEAARVIMDKEGLQWKHVIAAALENFVDLGKEPREITK